MSNGDKPKFALEDLPDLLHTRLMNIETGVSGPQLEEERAYFLDLAEGAADTLQDILDKYTITGTA